MPYRAVVPLLSMIIGSLVAVLSSVPDFHASAPCQAYQLRCSSSSSCALATVANDTGGAYQNSLPSVCRWCAQWARQAGLVITSRISACCQQVFVLHFERIVPYSVPASNQSQPAEQIHTLLLSQCHRAWPKHGLEDSSDMQI